MTNLTATDYVLIIGAIFTGICSVIAAWKSNKGSNIAVDNKQKLEEIHGQVNGNLSGVSDRLDTALRRNEYLQSLVNDLLDRLPPDTLTSVKEKMRARATDK